MHGGFRGANDIIGVGRTTVPQAEPDIESSLAPVHYQDTYSCSVPRSAPLTWEQIGEAIRKAMPWWAVALLGVRNALVGWTGVKTRREGKGEGYGIFQLFETHETAEDRRVLSQADKHLDFRIVVSLAWTDGVQAVSTTTLVQFHNRAGRVYFFFVKPFHRLIVSSMMRRTGRAVRQRQGSNDL